MTQSALAGLLHVSSTTLRDWRLRGMPTDSAEAARAWIAKNRRPAGRPRGWTRSRITVTQPAQVPPPAPPATAVSVAIPVAGSTTADLLERLESVERQAFEILAASKTKGDASLDRECVRAHKDATSNLLSARSEWLAQMERERILVSGDWVREVMAKHDGFIVTLARAMPRALAPRIAPHDPDHAEAELRHWVEDSFLSTLFRTNPFSNGNGSVHPEQPAV